MLKNKRRVNYRLYPSKQQEQILLNMLSLHQQLYNMALEQRIKAWRSRGVSVNYHQQAKDLTDLRAAFPEYKALNAQSSQNTLKRLDRAFEGFFRRLKQGEKAGFPRFKSITRYSGWGYNTYGDGWKLFLNPQKHGHLRLSGVGHLHIRGKAKTLGTPKTLDILYRQGKWYASVAFEYFSQISEQDSSPKGAVGLDWGVETFATLAHDIGGYTGIENPRYLRLRLDQLRQLQRSLARKKRGSRNYGKLKKQIAAMQSKIAQQRHDFLHQTSAKIVKENALITVEKLNIKAMTAKGGRYKRGLNREILSTAPSAFHKMLKYKAEEAGTIYIEVPTRQVKPSQTCSGCGQQVKKALSERTHACCCGLKLSRDENAARVLLNWALVKLSKGRESALCGENSLEYSLKHETHSIPIRVGGM